MKEFKGKTAFVTGAASGIGLALARTFLGPRHERHDGGRRSSRPQRRHAQSFELRGPGRQCPVRRRCGRRHFGSRRQDDRDNSARSTFSATTPACRAPAGSRKSRSADWEWVVGVNFYGTLHGIRDLRAAHARPWRTGPYRHHLLDVGPDPESARRPLRRDEVCAGRPVARAARRTGGQQHRRQRSVSRLDQNQHAGQRPQPPGCATAAPTISAPIRRLPRATRNMSRVPKNGLDPLDLAELVVRAIEENELYILTQPSRRASVEDEVRRNASRLRRASTSGCPKFSPPVSAPKT